MIHYFIAQRKINNKRVWGEEAKKYTSINCHVLQIMYQDAMKNSSLDSPIEFGVSDPKQKKSLLTNRSIGCLIFCACHTFGMSTKSNDNPICDRK